MVDDDNTQHDTVVTPPPAAAATHRAPGEAIGRYRIVRELGAGGMGLVYLAHDPTLDRRIALKLLRPELRGVQARLLREGQAIARLTHPAVVRIYDIGTDGDDLFIAMEYVAGSNLRQWLAAARRTPRAILEMFEAAGRGLAAAHRAGLVHRDFKPDNVLVGDDGRVVVTDFGVARLGADDVAVAPDDHAVPNTTVLTKAGALMGTPAYMSPEQLRGETADARSDQFSFCISLWEALFGERPFRADARASLDDLRAAIERGVVAPSPPVPASLAFAEQALRRGLAIARADRYDDIDALLVALAPPRDLGNALEEGERLGHFRIGARLGQGGMGVVYRARDEKLGREVALKVLLGDVAARPDRRERFLREARAAAAVVHPAIATVFEVGSDGDVPFIAMEYVAGRTLREVVKEGRMSPAELVRIAIPIAEGLSRAHRAGVVHRDLKPENVMLDHEGAPKMLDFGIARVFEIGAQTETSNDTDTPVPATFVTADGVAVGTPAYMSPEQARGHQVDARSDLFSFGITAFELVCGEPPFRGTSALDVVTAIIRDPAPVPSSLVAEIPDELERIILKCLEKDPGARYQTAADLAADLRRLQRDTESGVVAARVMGSTTQTAAPSVRARSRRVAQVAALLAICALVGFGVWVFSRGSREAVPASPSAPRAPLRFVDRELTATPSHSADAGSLSPDGKTLAIARAGRLMLQDIDSGDVRDLPPPAGPILWITWYPDGSRLLAQMRSAQNETDLLAIPIDGGAPVHLPFRAWGALVSPDGTRVATFDEAGLHVANVDGREPRLLAGTKQDAEFAWPAWSPDGRWIAYALRGPQLPPSIRSVAADGSADLLLIEDASLAHTTGLPTYLWLADGRILYVTHTGHTSSIMALDVDLANGRARGAPVIVATYPDAVGLENASRDGRRILYNRSHTTHTHYTLALDDPKASPQVDAHDDWDEIGESLSGDITFYTAPSGTDRTDLIASDASGHPRVLASRVGTVFRPRLTPDRATLLWIEVDPSDKIVSLARVSTSGGAVRADAQPEAPSVPAEHTDELVVRIACPRIRGQCVLGSVNGDELDFYDLDADGQRGPRLGSIEGAPPWAWDISPDGKTIAVARRNGELKMIGLDPWAPRSLTRVPDAIVDELTWLDDRSFVLAAQQVASWLLLRIDGNGRHTIVWRSNSERALDPRVFRENGPLYFRTGTWSRTFWLLQAP